MKGTTAILALTLSFSATSLFAQDTGYYAGLGASSVIGSPSYRLSIPYTADFTGSAQFAFIGYNHFTNGYLLGVEAAFMGGNMGEVDSLEGEYLDNVQEIRARFGMPFAVASSVDLLFYGLAGLTKADWHRDTEPEGTAYGIHYGAGVEFGLGGGWFTAAELVHRDLQGSYLIQDFDYYFDYTTAQIKIGKRF